MSGGGAAGRSGVRPVETRFDDASMWVTLDDGRVLGVPLAWFPRLMDASPAEREAAQIGTFGLHWDALDEDLSAEGPFGRIRRHHARGAEDA